MLKKKRKRERKIITVGFPFQAERKSCLVSHPVSQLPLTRLHCSNPACCKPVLEIGLMCWSQTILVSLELPGSKSLCCERGHNPPLPAYVAPVDVCSTARAESFTHTRSRVDADVWSSSCTYLPLHTLLATAAEEVDLCWHLSNWS